MRKNEPASMVAMNGRPKRRNGCRATAARIFTAELDEGWNFFDWKTAMIVKCEAICV